MDANRLQLQHRSNNAYDTLLLVNDGVVIGAWDMEADGVRADWDDPGDLRLWLESGDVDDLDPEDYGELVAVKY